MTPERLAEIKATIKTAIPTWWIRSSEPSDIIDELIAEVERLHTLGAPSPQSRTDVPCGSHEPPSTVQDGSDERLLALSEVELPPLPEGWRRLDDGRAWAGFYPGDYSDWQDDGCPVLATTLGVIVDNMGAVNITDLITVLRHAERAHLRMQEGHRG